MTESTDLDADEFNRGVDAEAVSWIRDAAKRVLGTNCTFVDDDLRLLEHLAARAVSAGLTEQLPASVRSGLTVAGGGK